MIAFRFSASLSAPSKLSVPAIPGLLLVKILSSSVTLTL